MKNNFFYLVIAQLGNEVESVVWFYCWNRSRLEGIWEFYGYFFDWRGLDFGIFGVLIEVSVSGSSQDSNFGHFFENWGKIGNLAKPYL
jgi:hypothetical protein